MPDMGMPFVVVVDKEFLEADRKRLKREIRQLEARLEVNELDEERLNWLETEGLREDAAQCERQPLPHSLFRRNLPITRKAIDIEMATVQGELRMSDLGWTCHVCGDERPDQFVSVRSRPFAIGEVIGHENIRYCNDRPACIEGSKTKTFLAHAVGRMLDGDEDEDDDGSLLKESET